MRFINRVAMALLLSTLAGTAAMAKTHKHQVRFDIATKVNGTIVKPGSYLAVFDDSTNEFTLLKGDKVVAKAPARIEQRGKKARTTELLSKIEGSEAELTGIRFGGSEQDVVLGQMGMQAGGNN